MTLMDEREPADGGGGVAQRLRRELIRRGHGLDARIIVGRQGITEAFVRQVDQALSRRDLLKVRIDAETGREADQYAAQLAARLNARVVQRVGRVALLYRPVGGGGES